jgi:hypothetical protein
MLANNKIRITPAIRDILITYQKYNNCDDTFPPFLIEGKNLTGMAVYLIN